MKRIAIIGMSGNSLFYEKLDNIFINVHKEVGGKGYNQAIACIRNGIKVSYLSAVGRDKTGIELEDFMKKEGIDTFFKKKDNPTLEAKIYVEKDGSNVVTYNKEIAATLSRLDVISFEEEIKRSDAILLQYEYPKEVIKEAIKLAKKHKKIIMINPAPMIYNDFDLIKDADIITPNEEEAYKLFLGNDGDFNLLLEKEKASGIKCIINTLGAKGLCVLKDGNIKYYQPIEVNVIDTTGAGDTFNGVFIANILKGLSFDEAIERGIVGSGLSVTKKYVMDAIVRDAEIEDYINKKRICIM